MQAAEEHPAEPVPLHIRNAPTPLMKGLGYGKGYRYDQVELGALAAGQEYLPESRDRGYEKTYERRW
jgi:putative ATPase